MKTYAAYSRDKDIRLNSSSGGFFSEAARYVLRENGIVYGTVLSDDCYSAHIVRIDTEIGLERVRGSKYIQAHVDNVYKEVKNDLKNGVKVLFSGTPCQINGLKCFLDHEYDKLICIDIVCHGVPSPTLWEKYVSEIELKYKRKVTKVNFRCKDQSWNRFGLKMIFNDNTSVYNYKNFDTYMQLFLLNINLRPSCYSCVSKQSRLTDITIADFWGIEHIDQEYNDGKGCSLVITRNEKGNQLFQDICDHLVYTEVNYADSIKENSAELLSAKKPNVRNSFYADVSAMNMRELENKYLYVSIKKKVKKWIIKSKFDWLKNRLVGD